MAEDVTPPIDQDIHTEPMLLQMGPSHPATHGTIKFLIELDGETVVNLDVQVGYLHRGFEKECESGSWYQAIPYTDRLNYNSAILANLGYCMAVEKLLGIGGIDFLHQWLDGGFESLTAHHYGDVLPYSSSYIALTSRSSFSVSSDSLIVIPPRRGRSRVVPRSRSSPPAARWSRRARGEFRVPPRRRPRQGTS